MSKDTATQAAAGGFPLASILTIIFVIAKLVGGISWSWWWVFSPLWISALLGIGIVVVVFVIAAIIAIIAALLN
jgi:hypothetical protein